MFKNTEPMYQIYVQLFALSVRSQPCIYYLYPVLNKYFSTIDILYIYMDRQIVHVNILIIINQDLSNLFYLIFYINLFYLIFYINFIKKICYCLQEL
jgi:hypothetical protein